MQTEIVIHQAEELEEVVQKSGLQKSEGDEVKQNYLPFLGRLNEIKEASVKVNFESPSDIDEIIARDLRLKTVKIRTGAEEVKDNRKKIHLLKGNLEQAAFNLIKADCLLIEEKFTQVEKAREIAESKRRAELKQVRETEVQPLTEFIPVGIDLGAMSQDDYTKLLSGAKLQQEAKIEAERKAEAERIAKEKAEAEERERIRQENEKLKAEAAAKEKLLQQERAKAEAERQKQDALMEAQRKEAAKKLAAEKAAKEKLEKEIRDREAAEIKAKKEAEEKAAKELKEKQATEAKAAKAPKKQKLNVWIDRIQIDVPNGMNEDETVLEIIEKFNGFKSWAKSKIDLL